ncbi:MAG: lasso peptide biosynthesis B2 protein [Erythrobacter sp.]|nr:lasso peptide biosynthesis B2 protein [Erythrobacter sp.]
MLALIAGLELARARGLLAKTSPLDVLRLNDRSAIAAAAAPLTRSQEQATHDWRICHEVAYAIKGMARRVPWRSDCLVQAMAAQHWLMRRGIASEIVIGTATGRQSEFEAHAWLAREGEVLLGGDISRFETLLRSR